MGSYAGKLGFWEMKKTMNLRQIIHVWGRREVKVLLRNLKTILNRNQTNRKIGKKKKGNNRNDSDNDIEYEEDPKRKIVEGKRKVIGRREGRENIVIPVCL